MSCLKKNKLAISVTCAVGYISLMISIFLLPAKSLIPGSAMQIAFTHHLAFMFQFFLTILGGIFTSQDTWAQLVGGLGVLACFAMIYGIWKKKTLNILNFFFLQAILFSILAAAAAAVLHTIYGSIQNSFFVSEAFSSRFVPYAVMFWIAVCVLGVSQLRENRFAKIFQYPVACVLVLLLTRQSFLASQQWQPFVSSMGDAQMSWYTQVNDYGVLSFLTTPSALDPQVNLYVAQKRFSAFSEGFDKLIGVKLKNIPRKTKKVNITYIQDIPLPFDTSSPFFLGQRVYGIVNNADIQTQSIVVVMNKQHRILGFAHQSQQTPSLHKKNFDEQFYFNTYPDIKQVMQGIPHGGWLHYDANGRAEGRLGAPLKWLNPNQVDVFGFIHRPRHPLSPSSLIGVVVTREDLQRLVSKVKGGSDHSVQSFL